MGAQSTTLEKLEIVLTAFYFKCTEDLHSQDGSLDVQFPSTPHIRDCESDSV